MTSKFMLPEPLNDITSRFSAIFFTSNHRYLLGTSDVQGTVLNVAGARKNVTKQLRLRSN